MYLIEPSTVYLAAQILVTSESFGACLIWQMWTLFILIVMNSFIDTLGTLLNGQTLYFTVIIMQALRFFILSFILSRISFHVVVLVYCQSYMFLFGAFILSELCMYPPVYFLSLQKRRFLVLSVAVSSAPWPWNTWYLMTLNGHITFRFRTSGKNVADDSTFWWYEDNAGYSRKFPEERCHPRMALFYPIILVSFQVIEVVGACNSLGGVTLCVWHWVR